MSDQTPMTATDWTTGAEAIVYQVCNACGSIQYFRRRFCCKCGSLDLKVERASGNGTVYRMSPIGQTGNWTHSVVYSFCSQADCRDGKAPMAELLREGAILYGTTLAGGFYGWGTVFQLRP